MPGPIYEAERNRPAPRQGAAALVPFLAAPRVGLCPVWDLPGSWSIPNWMIHLVFLRQTPGPDWVGDQVESL